MSDDFTTKKPLLRLMIVFLILTLPSLVLIPNPAGASGTDCTDPLITDFNPAYKFDQGDASYRWVTSMKLNYHDPPGIGVDLLWWDYTWPPSPEHLKPRIPDENDQVHFWMEARTYDPRLDQDWDGDGQNDVQWRMYYSMQVYRTFPSGPGPSGFIEKYSPVYNSPIRDTCWWDDLVVDIQVPNDPIQLYEADAYMEWQWFSTKEQVWYAQNFMEVIVYNMPVNPPQPVP